MAWILGEPTVQQYFDANGDALVNGSIEFFETGTSTPAAVASDSGGVSTATSYTLNSIGAPQTSGGTAIALFFDSSITYKIVRKDASGTPIAPTIDPYNVTQGAQFAIDAVDSGASDSLYDYVGSEDGQQAVVSGYYTAGDGGGGSFYWDASSTDADDGGVTILPTGHVGAGRWKRILGDLWLEHFGLSVATSSTNHTLVRNALDYLDGINGGTAFVKPKQYTFTDKIYNAEPGPKNVRVIAEGLGANNGGAISAQFITAVTGYLFDIVEDLGIISRGNLSFSGIEFRSTSVSAGIFSINDPDTTVATDDATSPNYYRNLRFEACTFIGPQGAVTANAIQAIKSFEIETDDLCEFVGWKRAIWLNGCDNCVIRGRFTSNVRHVMTERSNTFGNALKISARFFGPVNSTSGVETDYQLHLSTWQDVVIAPFLEGVSDACIYLNGRVQTVYDPWVGLSSSGTFLELGPDCVGGTIFRPKTTGMGFAMTAAEPTTWNWTASGTRSYECQIIDPSQQFLAGLTSGLDHPRYRLVNLAPLQFGYRYRNTQTPVVIGPNGTVVPHHTLGYDSFEKVIHLFGVADGASVVSDADAPYNYAIQLNTTNNADAAIRIGVIGDDLTASDRVTIRLWFKRAVGGGTSRWFIQRDAVNINNGDIGTSASYGLFEITQPLTGALDGEAISIGVFQANSVVVCDIAFMEVHVVRTPAYSVTNVVTTRTYDANTVTLATLADVVGTMIADDRAQGTKG